LSAAEFLFPFSHQVNSRRRVEERLYRQCSLSSRFSERSKPLHGLSPPMQPPFFSLEEAWKRSLASMRLCFFPLSPSFREGTGSWPSSLLSSYFERDEVRRSPPERIFGMPLRSHDFSSLVSVPVDGEFFFPCRHPLLDRSGPRSEKGIPPQGLPGIFRVYLSTPLLRGFRRSPPPFFLLRNLPAKATPRGEKDL